MGQLIYHSATNCTLEQIRATPLTTLAAAMRRDLSAANDPRAIRSYATYVAREPDKSQLVYGGMQNFDTDLGGSSISTLFRGLGCSEALSFGPFSVVYIFTSIPNRKVQQGFYGAICIL